MSPIIAISLAPAALLALYAAGHYASALLAIAPSAKASPEASAAGAVTVAVPARDEGEGAPRVVRSLLAQDHEDLIEIVLIVNGRSDSGLQALLRSHPIEGQIDDDLITLRTEESPTRPRRIRVLLSGVDPKHLKINLLLERLETPYLAILDCDHEARPDWIRTSLALLSASGGQIIQARREPAELHSLFGLWDSLHQHVGCEVANIAYDRLGMSVFFTGTTAVMDSDLLRRHPLRDCLTEDTDLSYTLLLEGKEIRYNPYSGSKEAVSPDLYSFLARRRRWAHGHTETFLGHLSALPSAPIGASGRLQFLFHGVHYLIALVVFASQGLVGLLLAGSLPGPVLAASVAAAALLAATIVRSQPLRAFVSAGVTLAVLAAWLSPAALFACAAALAASTGDLSQAGQPIPPWMGLLAVFGLSAPLSVLVVGLVRLRWPLWALLAAIASYPLALYLDIAGVLIGLVDLAAGQRRWLAIARAQPSEPSPPSPSLLRRSASLLAALRSNVMRPSRWLPIALAAGCLALGVWAAMPPRQIAAADRSCTPLEHDGHPWIVPPTKLPAYCSAQNHTDGTRLGSFSEIRSDPLAGLDTTYWEPLSSTFPCNNAVFTPENVSASEGGIALQLRPEGRDGKEYTSGSIATRSDDLLYGRYEVEMKPMAVEGVLTAFFLYRFDPWQEIDMEFLGRDTTKALINVYYNPGEPGDLYNYGYRGTPVLVDLGFDASEDFHTYAIEWDPNEIRWFADGQLIHTRPSGAPTPIPHLPMRMHINTWPICSEELAGKLDTKAIPASSLVRNVVLSRWVAPWGWKDEDAGRWRESAPWIR